MQIIPGPTGIDIATQFREYTNWPLQIPEFRTYPDGESAIRLTKKVADRVLIIQSCYNPQDTNLFQLLNLISTVKHQGAQEINVFVPYLCYARADRDVRGGEAISSRTVLELLEAVGCTHLMSLDVHNPEIFKFAKHMKCTSIYPARSFAEYVKGKIGSFNEIQIIAPDKGAVPRAKALASELDVAWSNLEKYRDPETGEVSLDIEKIDLRAREIVIVDDIVSTGSTLIAASDLLKIKGVERINYLITHAISSHGVARLIESGDGFVASTNSIPSLISKIQTTKDVVNVLNGQ